MNKYTRGAFDDLIQNAAVDLAITRAKNREAQHKANKTTDRGGALMASLTGDSTWLALDTVDDKTYQMMEDEE
jgi:hypothetical protein